LRPYCHPYQSQATALKDATLQFTGATAAATTRYLWVDQGAGAFDITQPSGSLTLTPSGGTVNHNITKTGPGALTMNAVISDGAAVTANNGTLALTAANSYTGATTISGGMLVVASDAVSGNAPLGAVPGAATANSIVLNGGVLSATGSFALNSNRGITIGPATGSGSYTGTISVAPGQVVTYGGVIATGANSGSNTLSKTGLGGWQGSGLGDGLSSPPGETRSSSTMWA
jgi:fibronectin-binding autotransporter adhesin